ncbi:MAG: type II toxin-antitoxin system VapC family toxin [Planctomycetes bacterium]|nr:type II toxin-antitoxin system VapC family toxin [Planctomycetota bacterium]
MDAIYIETSIVSHASAWPSRNPATAALQDQAKRWLAEEAFKYDLVTSQFVIDEVSRGDPDAAEERLKLLQDVRVLLPDAEVERVADEIISHSLMPAKARLDALHVASAAVGRVEYLLTQNCRHIANAIELPRVYDLLDDLGFPRLLICTPAEFLGDPDNGS